MGTTVIAGARVSCMDPSRTLGEAIALRDGAILAVGAREPVLRAAGDDCEVIDTGGALVLPGFIDAHHHVAIGSLYGGAARLTAPRVRDIPSLQAELASAAKALEPGRWLVAMEWDETRLEERRPPTLAELDDAVPDRPLFALHHTCHRALANSRGLALAGIDAHTPQPSGGLISRGRAGRPDGLLIERGMSRVEALARPDLATHDLAGVLDRMASHYRALVKLGITRVVDTAVPIDLMSLFRESARRGDVLVPTHVCPVSARGYLEEPWDVLDTSVTGEEEGAVTIGPVKLIFDGAPGCSMCLSWSQVVASTLRTAVMAIRTGSLDPVRTALSIEPRIGKKILSGIAIYRKEEAEKVVRAVTERGFSVATHAIGNRAIEVALDAYAAVGAGLHGAGTARIEHAAFLDRELAARMAGAGVAAVVQPGMLAMPMYATAVRIPGLPFFALRWMADAGVKLVGSSDHPVTTFDPLDGIRAAMFRKNARGVVVDEDQCLALDEALAMYTCTAAEVCGCLDRCGTLEPGKRADLVVIEGDLAKSTARVRATVVAGETVFGQIGG